MLSNKFDALITDGSPYGVIVMTQELEPMQGKDGVVFPPTYAEPQKISQEQREDWVGYDISVAKDGTKRCMLDSVGSQANRMEESFVSEPYAKLVPQIIIEVKGSVKTEQVNLLKVSHRAADALVRNTPMNPDIQESFKSIESNRDYLALAKLNPTALVFGVWDSRGTRVKIPSIINSEIIAYGIDIHTRSATYIPPVDYESIGVWDDTRVSTEKDRDALSKKGYNHAPSTKVHGGITAEKIQRTVTLNLNQIRILNTVSEEKTLAIRRYILGLSLVAASSKSDSMFNLRKGCVLRESSQTDWKIKSSYYDTPNFEIDEKDKMSMHNMAIAYATQVSNEFGVVPNRKIVKFDAKLAEKEIKDKDK